MVPRQVALPVECQPAARRGPPWPAQLCEHEPRRWQDLVARRARLQQRAPQRRSHPVPQGHAVAAQPDRRPRHAVGRVVAKLPRPARRLLRLDAERPRWQVDQPPAEVGRRHEAPDRWQALPHLPHAEPLPPAFGAGARARDAHRAADPRCTADGEEMVGDREARQRALHRRPGENLARLPRRRAACSHLGAVGADGVGAARRHGDDVLAQQRLPWPPRRRPPPQRDAPVVEEHRRRRHLDAAPARPAPDRGLAHARAAVRRRPFRDGAQRLASRPLRRRPPEPGALLHARRRHRLRGGAGHHGHRAHRGLPPDVATPQRDARVLQPGACVPLDQGCPRRAAARPAPPLPVPPRQRAAERRARARGGRAALQRPSARGHPRGGARGRRRLQRRRLGVARAGGRAARHADRRPVRRLRVGADGAHAQVPALRVCPLA